MVLLALLIASASASPAELIVEGQARWRTMALERAAASFEKARTHPRVTRVEQVTAFVWLGVVRTEMGDFPGAKVAFTAALRLDRGARLPELLEEPPPRVVGLFEAAKLAVDEENGVHQATPKPDPVAPEPVSTPITVDDLDPRDSIVAPVADEEPPWLLVAAGVAGGSGLAFAGTGAVVDVVAGPGAFDGGSASFACYGVGAALLVAGAAFGIAAIASAP